METQIQEQNQLLTNADATQREGEIAHDLELRRLRFEIERLNRELQAAKDQTHATATEFQKYKVAGSKGEERETSRYDDS